MNLTLNQYESSLLTTLNSDTDILFCVVDILSELKQVDLIPIYKEWKEWFTFAEVMCLCSEFPNLDLAFFCRNLLLDTLPVFVWKHIYSCYFDTFITSYFSKQEKYSSEINQGTVFAKEYMQYTELNSVELVGGYATERFKNLTPDFIFKQNNIVVAVGEFKLASFTLTCLKQLTKYMKLFNVDKGYAIASECNINLPNNVIFIKYKKVPFEIGWCKS